MNQIGIISGPLGGGKTASVEQLCQRYPDRVVRSISATTRTPRTRPDGQSEQDGVDYYFRSIKQFLRLESRGQLLELTNPSPDIYYGTPRRPVEKALALGKLVLFAVDYVGVEKISAAYPDAAIFWLTARYDILVERLKQRPNISPAEFDRRLRIIQRELSWHNLTVQREPGRLYDVWNDKKLESAVRAVETQLLLQLPAPIQIR